MITKAIKIMSAIMHRIESGELENTRGYKLVNYIAHRYNVNPIYVNDVVNGFLRI